MKPNKLAEIIDSLASDIDFYYKGKHGAICPFSHNDIALSYDGEDHNHISVEDAMNDKMFNGKCLNEISEQIELM